MRRKRRRHREKESSEQITKARTLAHIGGIQSFFKDITHFEKGPLLMLNPNMQPLMEDVRQLVKDYAALEKRASEIKQEREQHALLSTQQSEGGSCSVQQGMGQQLAWGFVGKVYNNVGYEFQNGVCECAIFPVG